jgi:hypothetical protein
MIGKALFAAALIVTSPAAFAEGLSGTPQEQAACRPDTRRFCTQLKADAGRFDYLACLKANREKLSRACRLVLESNGQ